MALDRPVHAPEMADGGAATAVAAPVALGSAVHGDQPRRLSAAPNTSGSQVGDGVMRRVDFDPHTRSFRLESCQVAPVFREFRRLYPNAKAFGFARYEDIETLIRPLGLR